MENRETHLEFYQRWGDMARPYFQWQMNQFSPYLGKRIGDVGCGIGNFVELFKDIELYFGLEVDKELIAEFKRLHEGNHVKLSVNGDILEHETVEEMKEHRLDTIICVNVLEHIQNDEMALSNMVNGVNAGGHICLLVPALNWLYGSLDTLDGHFRRYSKKNLIHLLLRQDLEVINCYYMNFIGAFMWFLKGRILKEEMHKNENYTLMNAILPVVSFIERMVKPPVGLSLVAICRKGS